MLAGIVTYSDSFLVPDLASNVSAGIGIEREAEVGQAAQNTAVSHGLCILSNDVAGAEIGYDA